MIDIHCHILPGIDDGSPDMETSLQMASIAATDGIHTIFATPHVTSGSSSLKNLLTTAVQELNAALRQQAIPVTVLFGAEVQAHVAREAADAFRLGESSFLLVEFPHSYIPADAPDLIHTLTHKGMTPIIAHPERNRQIIEEPWRLAALVNIGAKAQITAECVLGKQGMASQRCAEYILQNELAHYIATDSHAPRFREPILSKAVKQAARIVGEQKARQLVTAPGIFSSPTD